MLSSVGELEVLRRRTRGRLRREAVVDPAALVPQHWFMGIVVNLVGLLVVLLLIGGTNRLLIERLEIHKMG